MYDINLKNVKKGIWFYFIFFAFGVGFLMVLFAFSLSTYFEKKSMDSQTTSIRTYINSYSDEGSVMYSPIYYYEVNGEEYSCSSDTSSGFRPSEEAVTIYYDSQNPSRCVADDPITFDLGSLMFLLVPSVFIILAVVNFYKIYKRIKLIKELNQKGKLVKGLKYHLEGTGMQKNGVNIKRPVVSYTLPSGMVLTLNGDPRHDNKLTDEDGMVDLIIDENNPDNYFIDFEINRLSGNREEDFYHYDDVPQNSSDPSINYQPTETEELSPSQKSQTTNNQNQF